MALHATVPIGEHLAIVDTETGGIDPSRHPLIEVAYTTLRRHVDGDPITCLWNREHRVEDCDPEALEVNHYADRLIHRHPHAIGERELAYRVLGDLQGKVLVAANPHFDDGFLRALLIRHGLMEAGTNPPWSYRLLDIKSMGVGYLAARSSLGMSATGAIGVPTAGWSQRDVAEMIGMPQRTSEEVHTAAGDVHHVGRLLQTILLDVDPHETPSTYTICE